LPLFVWYPADPRSGGQVAEYLPYPADKIRGRLALERGRGRVLSIHTRADVPVAAGDDVFPVLLFSGGAGVTPSSYHSIVEDLVSHGYVVVGMDHTYDGAGQVLADGRVIEPTADNFRPQGDPQSEEFGKAAFALYLRRVSVRSADAALVVRMLTMMSNHEGGRFYKRLDLERIGVFGHSLGGYAAAHALMDVSAIKAGVGVNLDGHARSMPFDEQHTPMKPFMCIEAPSARPADEKLAEWKMTREAYETMIRETDERQAAAYRKNPTVSYRVTIAGAEHGSFSDETYPMPEKDGQTAALREKYTRAARLYLLEFFESSLRGKEATAFAAPQAEFGDTVRVEIFRAPGSH
jgi:predicted dienelactone hydrolase